MLKVHILATCSHCNGEAYVPMGEAKSSKGETYIRYAPCPMCVGSGIQPKRVSLEDFSYFCRNYIDWFPGLGKINRTTFFVRQPMITMMLLDRPIMASTLMFTWPCQE